MQIEREQFLTTYTVPTAGTINWEDLAHRVVKDHERWSGGRTAGTSADCQRLLAASFRMFGSGQADTIYRVEWFRENGKFIVKNHTHVPLA